MIEGHRLAERPLAIIEWSLFGEVNTYFYAFIIVSPVGAKCRLCADVFLFVENCSTPGFVLQEGKLLWRPSTCKCLSLK